MISLKIFNESPYIPQFACGDIGTAVAGAANAAATMYAADTNYQSTQETNANNLRIHREDNAFNASEAEKSRQFQRQMTEDYETEQAKMQQKIEAGINPVATDTNGGSVAPAPPQASSAPAPAMVAPQMPTDMDLGTKFLQPMVMGSEKDKLKSETNKTTLEAERLNELSKLPPEVQFSTYFKDYESVQLLRSQKQLTDSEKIIADKKQQEMDFIIDGLRKKNLYAFSMMFGEFANNMSSADNARTNRFNAVTNMFLVQQDMRKMADDAYLAWQKSSFDVAFNFGEYKKYHLDTHSSDSSSTSSEAGQKTTSTKVRGDKWSIGLDMSVGDGQAKYSGFRSAIMRSLNSIKLGFTGGYGQEFNSTDVVEQYNNSSALKTSVSGDSMGNSTEQHFMNEQVRDIFLRNACILRALHSGSEIPESTRKWIQNNQEKFFSDIEYFILCNQLIQQNAESLQ